MKRKYKGDNEMSKISSGDLVKVTYKQQSGNYRWYRWEMTAVYLGPLRSGYSEFSLRPLMGSTSLRTSDIETIEIVEDKKTVLAREHGLRDKATPVKLPKRFKGAL